MITTFGLAAERYARALHDIDAIVVEPAKVLEGYVEAVRRRFRGETFYGMLMLDENRDRVMTAIGAQVFKEVVDADQRRAILTSVHLGTVSVNDRPANEMLAIPHLKDEAQQIGAREFLTLCPALLVRSLAEYDRVSALWQRHRPYEIVVVEPPLPDVARRVPARPSIVLWAPDREADAVAFYAFALSEARADVTVVCAPGTVLPVAGVSVIGIDSPRLNDVLAEATCVVVANPTDPGAAVAFARRGYGVAAPKSSGAHEFVRDLCVFDPAVPRDIFLAATMAIGQPAAVRDLPPAPPPRPGRPALPVAPEAAPRATVIVPTFNRREDLERCLTCIAAQTYPRVEAVIVNDAGERMDDVVAAFPFARLLHLEQNGGPTVACMEGLKLVTDGFVQFLADDDWLYPDHIERLASAMLLSGAQVGHSNVAIRYVDRMADGSLTTTGYNVSVFIDTVTPTESMTASPIAGQGLLWRRSVFDEIGGWREDSILADQEIQLRAAQRYAFAFVDQVTAEWRVHGKNFSGKADAGTEQRRIYEELHPAPDRPIVLRMRQQMLDVIASRPPGYVFGPTLQLHRPEPL